MKISSVRFRQILILCAAITTIVAIVMATGVVPAVKAEVARGGTLEMAVTAFWINIGCTLLYTVSLGLIAIKSLKRSWIATTALIFIGLVIFFLGFANIDAASAYISHGESMHTASIILYVCGGIDYLAAVVTITAAILRTKES